MTPEQVALVQYSFAKVAPTSEAAAVLFYVEQLKASQEQAAHDNANGTEQLKASQEQMARDNAKLGEQLKASQEQIVRVPKASEQNLRPKRSTPQPRPTATMTSKPAPALRSPRARAQPQAPVQLQPEEQ